MYRTKTLLRRTVRVRYPAGQGSLVLRTDLDWDLDIEPLSVSADRTAFTFELEAPRPFVYVKPCLRQGNRLRWASGPNLLVLMTNTGVRDIHPFFEGTASGSFSEVVEISSALLDRPQRARVYLPPGYHENPLKRFPVLYMQDGKNLFFPDEAFLGQDWRVDESLSLLNQMNAVRRVIVVGIYSFERERDYTLPGYFAYGQSVAGEVKPEIDRLFRTRPGRETTGVIGSSLGGVVSFFQAWQWPEVFGFAACLSSTFSHRDDLIDRVLEEPKRDARIYLDSGWPGDNFEVTMAMAMALQQRGYVYGRDFVHFAFPRAPHNEIAWGARLHLPLQLFGGTVISAGKTARGRNVP